MGQSEAMIFAREGAKVAVADVLEFEARQVVEKIAAAGGQARFVKLDVTSETDWEAAVNAAVSAFGKLDLLVNNAGISGTFDPDTLSTSAWDTLLNVNAKGVFLGMKHAVPAMRAAGGGSIVNISSISGFVGQDRIHMGYNASKGAVRIMTKSAAVQFAQHGIRVNSVHPGIMPPMRTSKASADPAWRERSLRAVPLKREAGWKRSRTRYCSWPRTKRRTSRGSSSRWTAATSRYEPRAAAGVGNASFVVQDVAKLETRIPFDLITAFDAIHDQADPAGVLRRVRAALAPGGTFLMLDVCASS